MPRRLLSLSGSIGLNPPTSRNIASSSEVLHALLSPVTKFTRREPERDKSLKQRKRRMVRDEYIT